MKFVSSFWQVWFTAPTFFFFLYYMNLSLYHVLLYELLAAFLSLTLNRFVSCIKYVSLIIIVWFPLGTLFRQSQLSKLTKSNTWLCLQRSPGRPMFSRAFTSLARPRLRQSTSPIFAHEFSRHLLCFRQRAVLWLGADITFFLSIRRFVLFFFFNPGKPKNHFHFKLLS